LVNSFQNLRYQVCQLFPPQAFHSQPDYRWSRMPANLKQSMKVGIKRYDDSALLSCIVDNLDILGISQTDFSHMYYIIPFVPQDCRSGSR
jgi:hypothetical protein